MPHAEGVGDRGDLSLAEADLDLLDKIAAAGTPLVLVLNLMAPDDSRQTRACRETELQLAAIDGSASAARRRREVRSALCGWVRTEVPSFDSHDTGGPGHCHKIFHRSAGIRTALEPIVAGSSESIRTGTHAITQPGPRLLTIRQPSGSCPAEHGRPGHRPAVRFELQRPRPSGIFLRDGVHERADCNAPLIRGRSSRSSKFVERNQRGAGREGRRGFDGTPTVVAIRRLDGNQV